MKNKKKNNSILKIIGSSSILTIASIMVILICILMIFDFFGAELTKEKISNNAEYADLYKQASNKYIKNGYVPLQRLLYFYLEDQGLTFDTLYQLNQNSTGKIEKEISVVCEDERVKNMGACTASNIESNKEYLSVPTPLFNFPLKTSSYTITSFYNEQRIIYGEPNVHSGWDLATTAQTPLYSVCNGTVHKVTYTQNENIPYDQSGNKTGNIIILKCDQDYAETYYVTYAHLYPNSAKVKVGDSVHDIAPIADLTVDEVIAIGEELSVPKEVLYRVPDDGLSNQTDEDKLGVTYKEIASYIAGEKLPEEVGARIEKLHKNNLHKFNIPTYRKDNN